MASLRELRRAAVAGTWYPSRADLLTAEVDDCLAHVASAISHCPVALVAPHAGLRYSGPVAAYAYAALQECDIELVVLIGPSHYVEFDGVSVHPTGAFETPLGPVVVDEDSASALLARTAVMCVYPPAHTREHSLEMQLPFLKRVLPEAHILPLVMGLQTRETSFESGRAIADTIRGRNAVVVASSDLSHYHEAGVAARLDAQVMRYVPALDAEGLMSLLERQPAHACGGGPMVAAMVAARALGASEGHVLHYADSGDVTGDKTSVVGYLAAEFSASPDRR